MKINNINDLPAIGIRHNPAIKKKVIIDKGNIPQLMIFGEATFQPGQSVDEHKHDTMFEVFYIQQGEAHFVVAGKSIILREGDCLTI